MGLFKRERREAAAPSGESPAQPMATPAAQAPGSGSAAVPQTATPPPGSTLPAQPPPAATPLLAPPLPDGELKKLGDQLASLTKLVQSEQESIKGFQTKVGSMEERMRFLQHVSEVISMNYNPFLVQEEGAVFEGLRPRLELAEAAYAPAAAPRPSNGHAVAGMEAPADHVGQGPPPSRVGEEEASPPGSPGGVLSLPVGVEVVPVLAAEGSTPPPPAEPWTEAPDAPTVQAASARAPLLSVEPTADSLETELAALAPRDAIQVHLHRDGLDGKHGEAPADRPAPARPPASMSVPLASTVALAWFEHLLRHAPARALHDLLDFYHGVGWVPDDGHAWLGKLASGVTAKPRTPAERRAQRGHEGKRRGPSPLERVALHRASLRFAERLFGPRTPEAERVLLEHELRAAAR